METTELLRDIHEYCRRAGMRPSTFGAKAVNDGKLVGRLEGSGQCLPKTVEKIRRFMRQNPPEEKAGAA